MFDRVWIACPQCGNPIEFQSKAGKCHLIDYQAGEVPLKIAGDIAGGTAWCKTCQENMQAAVAPPQVSTVPMIARKPQPEDEDDDER
jgi:hypothetical protein